MVKFTTFCCKRVIVAHPEIDGILVVELALIAVFVFPDYCFAAVAHLVARRF